MDMLDTFTKLTVKEFLALPETHQPMELVDGEVIMSPRPLSEHQELVHWLSHLLRTRVGRASRILGEKELMVKTKEGLEGVRVPDLCYVRQARRRWVRPEAIRGTPDIIVEILSQATEEVDRITKRDEYQATGVAEYWIVDIPSRSVLVHYFPDSVKTIYKGREVFESRVLKELGLPCQFSIAEIFEIFD